jgi:hypothetical protein
MQVKSEGSSPSLGANGELSQAVWNFTELNELILSKCNNTYKVIDEYMLSGAYELWMTLDLPW